MGKLTVTRSGRPLLAISAAAMFAAIISAGALADGVVVASTSSNHAVGDRVAVGARVRVEAGAEVTVLDRSGVTQRIAAPGKRYDEPASVSPPSRGEPTSALGRLALSFTSLGRRAGLGTMRGAEGGDCDADPGSRSIGRAACAAAETEDDAGPWGFSIQSEMEGFMSCDFAGADGAWRRLPLGLDGALTPIGAGRLYEFSSDGEDAWPDPAEGEDVEVRCQAVDDATWFALAPRWSADYGADEARAVMTNFAAVSGGTFAEVAVEE